MCRIHEGGVVGGLLFFLLRGCMECTIGHSFTQTHWYRHPLMPEGSQPRKNRSMKRKSTSLPLAYVRGHVLLTGFLFSLGLAPHLSPSFPLGWAWTSRHSLKRCLFLSGCFEVAVLKIRFCFAKMSDRGFVRVGVRVRLGFLWCTRFFFFFRSSSLCVCVCVLLLSLLIPSFSSSIVVSGRCA